MRNTPRTSPEQRRQAGASAWLGGGPTLLAVLLLMSAAPHAAAMACFASEAGVRCVLQNTPTRDARVVRAISERLARFDAAPTTGRAGAWSAPDYDAAPERSGALATPAVDDPGRPLALRERGVRRAHVSLPPPAIG